MRRWLLVLSFLLIGCTSTKLGENRSNLWGNAMKARCFRSLLTPWLISLMWLTLCVYLLLTLAGCSAGGGQTIIA